MPNQSHSGIRGIPWYRCSRCGCDFQTSELQPQKGLLLCHQYGCYDNLLVEERDNMIQQVLQDGPDAPPARLLEEPTFENVDDYIV